MSSVRCATFACIAFAFWATFNSTRMLAPIGRELITSTKDSGSLQLRARSAMTVDQPRPKLLEYVLPATKHSTDTPPSTQSERKALEFVHIPKTGGTAIEYAASLANITWGLCHWKARPAAGLGCHHPDWAGFDARQTISFNEIQWEHWHVPPRHMTTLESPYKNKELFAVVRNPYERFISEFYCPYTGWDPVDWTQEDLGFRDPMGKPLPDALQDAMSKEGGEQMEEAVMKPQTPNALNLFLMQRLQWFVKWTAHYLPQSDYVYDKEGVQIVDHVLKYERLSENFADLMASYNLPVHLDSTVNQRIDDTKRVRLTVMDLFPETIRRINEVARQDFTNFGYSMIDPERLAAQRAREQTVQRIYYINLLKNTQRRELMESWLSMQTIPFERINATIGSTNPEDCVSGKQHLDRCRGLSGLAKTELDIIRNHNTSGLTLVFEDDFVAYEPLDEVVARTLKMVPSDWDVIRWDCWGEPPDVFDVLVPNKVFRTYANATNRYDPGWYCGGTHAMLWREESISKLEQIWSREPFDDIDCRLTTLSLNSYCVNIGIGGLEKLKGEPSDIPKIESSSPKLVALALESA